MKGTILKLVTDNTEKFNDFDLIKKTLSGEWQAFEELYNKYEQLITALIYPYIREKSYLEDAVQDIFIKVYKGLPRFKMEASFKTWIFRIAVNHIKNINRKKQRVKKDIETDVIEEKRSFFYPEAAAFNSMIGEKIKETVSQLEPEKQTLFNLRYVEELSIEEISKIMSISKGTIKSRLFYVREYLKKELEYLYN